MPEQRRLVTLLSGICLLLAMAVQPPADVVERSAHAGACGLTSVWRWTGEVRLTALITPRFLDSD